MAKDLKEQIEIMTHYLNGGKVEFSDDCFKTVLGKANKKDDKVLGWDWEAFKYRIVEPEKQKVTIEKWLCSDNQGGLVVIETTNIEEYRYITKKLKLIESYEVEL